MGAETSNQCPLDAVDEIVDLVDLDRVPRLSQTRVVMMTTAHVFGVVGCQNLHHKVKVGKAEVGVDDADSKTIGACPHRYAASP